MNEKLKDVWKVITRKKTSTAQGMWQSHLRGLSIVDVTCLGLSTTLGTGVYILIAVGAHDYAGPSVVLAILMAAVTSCLGGLCYSESVTRFPKGGSAYSYVYATVGEFVAFLVGWSMLLEYTIGTALAAKACSQHLDLLLDGRVSDWLIRHLGHIDVMGLDCFVDLPSVSLMLMICVVLMISLKVLCSLNNMFTVINLLVIFGIVIVGIFNMDSENWIAGLGFFPGHISGIISAASLSYYAFVGYDVISICTKNSPHRSHTFPTVVSTIFTLGLLAAFATAIVLTLLIPFSMIEDKAPILQAFDLLHISGMRYFAFIGAFTGLASATIASLISLVKLVLSLSTEGLLFSFLSRTQCHALVPAVTIVSSVSLLCDIKVLVHVLGMGTLVSSVSVAIAVICSRYGLCVSAVETLELSEENSTADSIAKPTEILTEVQEKDTSMSEKDSVHDKMTLYGSIMQTRSLSVDMVDESFITCLTEMSPHWTKQEPSHRSAAIVSGLMGAVLLVMLLMGVTTIHIPRLLPESKWWIELCSSILFIAIVAFVAIICRQPRNKQQIKNLVPCIPFLPLFAIWIDVHLIVGLPYSSWIVYGVWTLIGILLYFSYGIRNSTERRCHDPQNVNLLTVNEEGSDSEIVQQNDFPHKKIVSEK